MVPLRREFEAMRAAGRRAPRSEEEGHGPHARRRRAPDALPAFLDRLRAVRVLDPACGSGNFLYMALRTLKDLENEAITWGSRCSRRP